MEQGVFMGLSASSLLMSCYAVSNGDLGWSLMFLLGAVLLYWAALAVSEERR